MLQQKIVSNGYYLLKNTSNYFRRLVSYESPISSHQHSNLKLNLTEQIPSSCHILIAGGGILGQSIAYHLSEIGVKDIVLIEKTK